MPPLGAIKETSLPVATSRNRGHRLIAILSACLGTERIKEQSNLTLHNVRATRTILSAEFNSRRVNVPTKYKN